MNQAKENVVSGCMMLVAGFVLAATMVSILADKVDERLDRIEQSLGVISCAEDERRVGKIVGLLFPFGQAVEHPAGSSDCAPVRP